MKHYSGNYFCTKSHWNGDFFDANNLVAIEDNQYDDECEFSNEDWETLILEKEIFDEERYSIFKDMYKDRPEELKRIKPHCVKEVRYLKPEVMKWLETNVKDTQAKEKGWCVGNDEYNSHGSSMEFTLFFYRRKDALSFIKEWSVYKKPTETYNQNTYVAKKLDLKTNKLVVEERE